MPSMNIRLKVGMKQGMILGGKVVLNKQMREGGIVIKYKLYAFSGATYVVPLDKYEYVDNTVERCFEDYCAGLLTPHELDRFVEECIIDNGGRCFDIWCDDYYVIMNKGK